MTSLSPDFFDKRAEEIERWKSEGFVELGDLLRGTVYIPEDLEITGVLQRKLALVGLESLDGYEPTPEWKGRIRQGDYMTTFLPCKLSDGLMKALSDNNGVQKRVEGRQEVYRKRKISLEKRRLLEDKKKEEESKKNEEKRLRQEDNLVKSNVDDVTDKSLKNRNSETSSDQVCSDGESDSGTTLSTTGLVAIPSMLLLSAIILRHLGSDDSPGLVEWALMALFSYSPIRYVFRSGLENAAGQLKTLAMGTVLFLVVGAGISNCSGMSTSGSSCWYIVGCI